MANEIVVRVILDQEMNVEDTLISIAVSNSIPFEAVDYIVADALREVSSRIFLKLQKINKDKNLS